jgi:hypothetical protein
MVKSNQYTIATFILAAIYFYSCNSDNRTADALYKRKEYLLQEFRDKSIISRGKIFYQLSYHKGQTVNTFYFEKKDGILVFTNDTIQYPVNEILAFTTIKVADSLNYREGISNELMRLLKVMDDFRISHVSAEDKFAGIDMKIYFGDYKALLYVRNVAGIKNERWKSYVLSGQKFDENWYYVKEE